MGFTIVTPYSLLGLRSVENLYVTIKGSFQVTKVESPVVNPQLTFPNPSLNMPDFVTPYYSITCTVYFQASKADPVITHKSLEFSLQTLPSPADLYTVIYDKAKQTLDPKNKHTDQQTLVFLDDRNDLCSSEPRLSRKRGIIDIN